MPTSWTNPLYPGLNYTGFWNFEGVAKPSLLFVNIEHAPYRFTRINQGSSTPCESVYIGYRHPQCERVTINYADSHAGLVSLDTMMDLPDSEPEWNGK